VIRSLRAYHRPTVTKENSN